MNKPWICTISIAIALNILAVTALSASSWPQFKGDMANSGTVLHSIGATDSMNWTVAVDEGTWIAGCVLDGAGNVVFLSVSGKLYSVSPSGSINWSVTGLGNDNWGGVAYSDGNNAVYCTCYSAQNDLNAVDATTGSLLWSFQTGNNGCDTIPTIGPDGTIYIGTYGNPGRLLALTDLGNSASMKWSVSFGSGYTSSAVPAYSNGLDTYLFFTMEESTQGGGEPNLACIRDDGTSGSIVWSAQIGHNSTQGTVDSAGNFYMVTLTTWSSWLPANVFKFDATGNSLWTALPEKDGVFASSVCGSPTLSADESTMYWGDDDGRVWAMNTLDGTVKWVYTLDETDKVIGCTIALQDDTLYVVMSGSNTALYRLQDMGANAIRIFRAGLEGSTTSTPCVANDGTVYVIPHESILYAFSPETDEVEILAWGIDDGVPGQEYYDLMPAWGGDRPYTWSITAGLLPPGLALNSATGEITGTPTTAGFYSFSIMVTDSTTPTPTSDTASVEMDVCDPPTFTFEQINWYGIDTSTIDSSWGKADLEFNSYSTIKYFNLNVDGRWVVQNMSIGRLLAPGTPQSLFVFFDLDVAEGTDVTGLHYTYSIGSGPREWMPTGTLITAPVADRDYQIGGLEGIDLGSPGPFEGGYETLSVIPAPDKEKTFEEPVPLGKKKKKKPKIIHSGKLPDLDKFVNQPQGKNECVPGAISNSLKYLRARGKIRDFPNDIDDVKEWIPWSPGGVRGTDKKWVNKKGNYLRKKGLTQSDWQAPLNWGRMKKLMEELNRGQDIEIRFAGHAAVLAGMRINSKGEIEMDTFDDDQKDDKSDPMKTAKLKRKAGGKFWYLNGRLIVLFIIECPDTVITGTGTPGRRPRRPGFTHTSSAGTTYTLEASTDPYDANENNMTWITLFDSVPGQEGHMTWEDPDELVTPEKYYRVFENDPVILWSRTQIDSTLGVMVTPLNQGRNMVSSPFEPFPEDDFTPGQSSLDKSIGDQLTGSTIPFFSDTIEVWDKAAGNYKRAWYNTATGEWEDWDGGPPHFGWDADVGYWISIPPFNPPTDIMQIGLVSPTHRQIDIQVGRSLAGSCFPVEVALPDTGLVESGFTGSSINFFSDTVEFWNPVISNYDRFWYNTTASEWQGWQPGPLRNIQPCDAIWVTALVFNSPFTWTYPKPGMKFVGDFEDGVVGQPYISWIEAEDGVPPYLFFAEWGGLPPGLTLDAITGTVTGVPLEPGYYTVDITVLDSDMVPAHLTEEFMIVITE